MSENALQKGIQHLGMLPARRPNKNFITAATVGAVAAAAASVVVLVVEWSIMENKVK